MRDSDPDRARNGALSNRRILVFLGFHVTAVFGIAVAAAIAGAEAPVLPLRARDYAHAQTPSTSRPESLSTSLARLSNRPDPGAVPAWVQERRALDAPSGWSEGSGGRIVLHVR